MTSKLCLHGVHIAHPESFAADVARLLQGRVIRGRLREKEYGEGKSARFRRSLLRERDGQFPCQIHLLEGILLAEGSLVALYDVEFAYEHGAERQVMEDVYKRQIESTKPAKNKRGMMTRYAINKSIVSSCLYFRI